MTSKDMDLVPVSEYWDVILKSRETPVVGLIYRIPPRFWRDISKIQQELRSLDKRHVYAKPSTLHVTVKAFGRLGAGIDETKLESILSRTEKVLSEFSPFNINLKGLSFFPTSIYVKVEDPLQQFRMINKRLIEEFGNEIEKSEYDADAFIPHVTIATFNSKEAREVISKVKSRESQNLEFGSAQVFELEAIEARMYLAVGTDDVQDGSLSYLKAFELGKHTRSKA
ncbi:MAG: 2'-5' RNA ligase family protein [Nitrososphaerales archaeon]